MLFNPNYAVGGEVPQFSRRAELSALVGFTTPDRHRDRKSPFACHRKLEQRVDFLTSFSHLNISND
jgi:hypothetical protein